MSAPATNQTIQPNSNESVTDIQMLLPKCLGTVGTDAKSVELRVAFDAPTSQQVSVILDHNYQHVSELHFNIHLFGKMQDMELRKKMMLALKAKKFNRYIGVNREKKNETASGENLDNQDQGLPFPPDLRTHSQQR
ncbi:hypothetical protein GCK72_013995 [Caenorhabditis remanei]|uniref:Uncharacterized protein n=1 Tax=Caenorhabditis remanei TaxID=31234 RepID=A0A6A5GST2_CAERE|nr:hypothetical protein GCK72_013995 [Caenorhabditis remanei]KAF1757539.1 hypothetical protein GCK72_013995 [Caenorhabditis remanei]